jgi:hypothetical protein
MAGRAEAFLLKHMLPERANAVVNTHIRESPRRLPD